MKIILIILLVPTCLFSTGWQQLKSLQAYSAYEFHLKESIKCLEFGYEHK